MEKGGRGGSGRSLGEWEEFVREWEGVSESPVCSSDQLLSPSPQQVYTFPLPNPKRLKEIPTDVSHEINTTFSIPCIVSLCELRTLRVYTCIVM